MTQHTNRAHHAHRRAIAVLLAAAALPATALAQETVTPPTVLVPSQQAPAPAAQAQPGESRTRIAPGVAEAAEQEARERAATALTATARTERAAARPQPRDARPAPRAEAPARPAATPAPVTAPESAAPVAATPQTPPPTEIVPPPVETAPPAETAVAPEPAADSNGGTMWLILAALGLAAAAIAGFLLFRRRRDDEVYGAYETEPVVVQPKPVRERIPAPKPRAADPVAAAPIFVAPRREPVIETPLPASAVSEEPQPSLENAEFVKPDAADIKAVLGGAKPQGERPQLELAMRPTRAGMSRRGAMVEFELTVANAGGLPAEDVRIGAFMLGGNAAAPTEIERLLMHPPADQVVPAERIEPGGGTRLNASVTLPREQVDAGTREGEDGFTPVLVADARYRLPDGSEGRTAAAFTIGRVNGGAHLVPIALQDDPAMYADIEARLHSVPAKV
ncbi:LPXTG cell wall anchor domain-containing protein [Sphingomonas koreensis]